MTATYVKEWLGLLAEGRQTITAAELVQKLDVSPEAAEMAIQRAQQAGWLFSPVRGLYVVVPPEYRSWGVIPGERFIDAAMRHLHVGYYVGYLSAAAHHGASHQAAQVFQVVVDHRLRDREIGGLRLRYYYSTRVSRSAATTVRGEHGRWRVSTPEATLLDLLERPERGGGIGNVMTVARSLPLDAGDLADAAADRGPTAARRAGWVIARVRSDVDTARLAKLAKSGAGAPSPLDARGPGQGPVDRRWWIRENAGAEADR